MIKIQLKLDNRPDECTFHFEAKNYPARKGGKKRIQVRLPDYIKYNKKYAKVHVLTQDEKNVAIFHAKVTYNHRSWITKNKQIQNKTYKYIHVPAKFVDKIIVKQGYFMKLKSIPEAKQENGISEKVELLKDRGLTKFKSKIHTSTRTRVNKTKKNKTYEIHYINLPTALKLNKKQLDNEQNFMMVTNKTKFNQSETIRRNPDLWKPYSPLVKSLNEEILKGIILGNARIDQMSFPDRLKFVTFIKKQIQKTILQAVKSMRERAFKHYETDHKEFYFTSPEKLAKTRLELYGVLSREKLVELIQREGLDKDWCFEYINNNLDWCVLNEGIKLFKWRKEHLDQYTDPIFLEHQNKKFLDFVQDYVFSQSKREFVKYYVV